MAGRSISIDEKIERQKEITFALKDKYEAAVAELDALIQKKKELLVQKKSLPSWKARMWVTMRSKIFIES